MKFHATTAQRLLIAGMLMILAGAAGAQQAYPGKPIRLIVPYPPGGSTTPVARLIGDKLAESWGQQVIVDNRPGGNTIIGHEALIRSAPDGYTLLLSGDAQILVPLLFPTSFDTLKDFAPVGTFTSTEKLLVLHPSIPANNLREFIAFAKSRPGQLNYATSGSGGLQHLASEMFNMLAGVKIQHVPYKGGGIALTDLLGGQVQLSLQSTISIIQHVKAGRLKGIAISGEKRFSGLPQIPTFAEAGLPGLEAKTWYWILAPAGTPKPVVDKISAELVRILTLPDTRERLAAQAMDPHPSTPEQLAAIIRAEIAKDAKIIKAANIRIDK